MFQDCGLKAKLGGHISIYITADQTLHWGRGAWSTFTTRICEIVAMDKEDLNVVVCKAVTYWVLELIATDDWANRCPCVGRTAHV